MESTAELHFSVDILEGVSQDRRQRRNHLPRILEPALGEPASLLVDILEGVSQDRRQRRNHPPWTLEPALGEPANLLVVDGDRPKFVREDRTSHSIFPKNCPIEIKTIRNLLLVEHLAPPLRMCKEHLLREPQRYLI